MVTRWAVPRHTGPQSPPPGLSLLPTPTPVRSLWVRVWMRPPPLTNPGRLPVPLPPPSWERAQCMEQAAGWWAVPGWKGASCGLPGEQGVRGGSAGGERGMCGCRPEHPGSSSSLLPRGPFWVLCREVPGVPGWHRAWCGVQVAITTPPAGPPLPLALWRTGAWGRASGPGAREREVEVVGVVT